MSSNTSHGVQSWLGLMKSQTVELGLPPREARGNLFEDPKDPNQEEDNVCPICLLIPPAKIFQCREGHIVCEPCLRKIQQSAETANTLPKCPSCAGRLDNDTISRVRVLENQLDRLTLNCCHKNSGCSAKLKRDNIGLHESECPYGQGIEICGMLGNENCSFKVSAGNAKTVFEHIKTCHPLVKFQKRRFSDTWNLKEAWEAVFIGRHPYINFAYIAKVQYSQHHVLIIAQVSNESVISFYSVDLSLGLSVTDEPRMTFSISNKTATKISWSLPIACGIDSWKCLSDENYRKPLEIGIHSLLQHCDQNGKLKFDVVVEQNKTLTPPAKHAVPGQSKAMSYSTSRKYGSYHKEEKAYGGEWFLTKR